MNTNHIKQKKAGFLLVLVLVFGAIFFGMIVAFTGYVVTQRQSQEAAYNKERALGTLWAICTSVR